MSRKTLHITAISIIADDSEETTGLLAPTRARVELRAAEQAWLEPRKVGTVTEVSNETRKRYLETDLAVAL